MRWRRGQRRDGEVVAIEKKDEGNTKKRKGAVIE
jgi:hypothetical protein